MKRKDGKWKQLLEHAEQQAEERAQELKALLAKNETIKHKNLVMRQIIDGLSAMSELMMLAPSLSSEDNILLDDALASFLTLELQIQEQICHLDTITGEINSKQHSSTISSCSPYCIEFLHQIHEPELAQQILAMSEQQLISKLRDLVGKCAILLVQGYEQPCRWENDNKLEHNHLTGGTAVSMPNDSAAVPATVAVVGVAAAGGAVAQAVSEPMSCSSSMEKPGPEFECACLAATVMQWDIAKYMRIAATNLETGQPLEALPPSYWLNVGRKLHLTAAQLATFRGLKDLLNTAMDSMFQNLAETTKHQEELILQQEVQLDLQQLQFDDNKQQQQCPEQQHVAASLQLGDTGALHQAHAGVIQVQSGVLKRWHIFWIHMGIVVLNTLTPLQMAMLITASYPSVMRIDTAVLDHLDELQQQLEQQQ